MKRAKNKSVFFDLGNVVIFFCHKKMCQQIAKLAGCSVERIEEALFTSPLIDSFERGSVTSQEVYKEFCKTFSIQATQEEFFYAMSDIFSLNEEILPILYELKDQGVELILLSNTCVEHFTFAQKRFNALSLFDKYVLSYEVGIRKPEKEIYLCAIAKSSSEISNCFYTDDIKPYTEAARAMGINSHTFTKAQTLRNALFEHGFLNEKKA